MRSHLSRGTWNATASSRPARRLFLPVSREGAKLFLGLEIGDEDLLKSCQPVPLCAIHGERLMNAMPGESPPGGHPGRPGSRRVVTAVDDHEARKPNSLWAGQRRVRCRVGGAATRCSSRRPPGGPASPRSGPQSSRIAVAPRTSRKRNGSHLSSLRCKIKGMLKIRIEPGRNVVSGLGRVRLAEVAAEAWVGKGIRQHDLERQALLPEPVSRAVATAPCVGTGRRRGARRPGVRPRPRSTPHRSSSSRRAFGRSWRRGARAAMGRTSKRGDCGSMHGRPSWPVAPPDRRSSPATPGRACWSTRSTTAKPTRCRPSRNSPPAEIATLTDWVQMAHPGELRLLPGRRTPKRPGEPGKSGSGLEGESFQERAEYWSFQPIRRVTSPTGGTRRLAWARNPIDRFILAGLERTGTRPRHPRPSKRTLIRRLSFDLTGLPPTPDEVEAFLGRSLAGRLRVARRPAPGQPAIRRAVGPPLARPGSLSPRPPAMNSTTISPTPFAIATT